MTDPTPIDPLERLDASLRPPACEINDCRIAATDFAPLACGHDFFVCRMHRVQLDVTLQGEGQSLTCRRASRPVHTDAIMTFTLEWVEL